VTRTRTEHLSEGDKAKARGPRTPLHSFLGIADTEDRAVSPDVNFHNFSKRIPFIILIFINFFYVVFLFHYFYFA
jgi:hypothetical protein